MRRSATDILRRGFDITVANWPLIAIRMVESFLLFAITAAAVFAVIVPVAVSAGMGNFSDIASVSGMIVQHWVVLLYALVIVAVVLVILVAVHAFVDGGIAQILIDSERAGAKKSFDMSRLLAGGRQSWWAIFWIYNIVWSIAGLILLIPLIATLALMIIVDDNTARIGVGCFGTAVTFILLLPLGLIAGVWTQKAIALCVARNLGAAESMRAARQEIRGDLARHLTVAFIAIVVAIGGAGVIGLVSMPLSFMHQGQPLLMLMTAPVQIVVSFAQAIFSAAAGTWFLAAFIALTEEKG